MRWPLIGLGTLCMATVGLLVAARYPAIEAIQPPAPASFPREDAERGAVLATVGNCRYCHTAENGQPYAGGYMVSTAFGAIYSTNITPGHLEE